MREIDRGRADMDFLQIYEPGESAAIDAEVGGVRVGQRHGERLRAPGEGERHAAHQPELLGDLRPRARVGYGLVEEAHGVEFDCFQSLQEWIFLAREEI